MWSLIDDELLESVRQTRAVKDVRGRLESEVMDGTTSAMEAAQEVLTTFAGHLPHTWMTDE
jgi:hypothetical protein